MNCINPNPIVRQNINQLIQINALNPYRVKYWEPMVLGENSSKVDSIDLCNIQLFVSND